MRTCPIHLFIYLFVLFFKKEKVFKKYSDPLKTFVKGLCVDEAG